MDTEIEYARRNVGINVECDRPPISSGSSQPFDQASDYCGVSIYFSCVCLIREGSIKYGGLKVNEDL